MSDAIDTTNTFLVGSVGARADRRILIQSPRVWQQRLTPEEALNLAAWIVAIVGEEEQFKRVLQAVCNT